MELVIGLMLSGAMLLAGAAPSVAQAETKRVCWVNPVENTDGSDIPATGEVGSTALDRIYVQYGTRDGTAFGTIQGRVSVAAPANCLDLSLVVVQEYALRAFVCNKTRTDSSTADAGLSGCSDFSNVALVEVQPPRPMPPSGLATQGDPLAYTILQSDNRIALVPVGRVPEGTPCDASQPVLDKFVIPRSAVQWASSSVQPRVVLGSCG